MAGALKSGPKEPSTYCIVCEQSLERAYTFDQCMSCWNKQTHAQKQAYYGQTQVAVDRRVYSKSLREWREIARGDD